MTQSPDLAMLYSASPETDFEFSTVNTTTSSTKSLNISTFTTDCVILHLGEFIPWNNPDNIISYEVEDLVRKLKDLIFLPVLFLIGCPANIINMLIFYKQGIKERINVCLFALSFSDEAYLATNMLWYGEQLYLQFTTKEVYGPVMRFLTNNNLVGFYGFIWVSQVLTAIIAIDRCFCILKPLRSQTILRTSTMIAIVVAVNVMIVGLFFVVVTRYRVACAYEPVSGSFLMTFILGEFYSRHKLFIDYMEAFVFGAGLPGLVMVIVVAATIITTIKLQQAASWRAETSTSIGLSSKEIALTKMLVANSVFFIVCVIPFFVGKLIMFFMPEANNGGRQHNFHLMIQWILIITNYFNSTFNFIVYYSMGTRYRQTFWQLFGRKNPGK